MGLGVRWEESVKSLGGGGGGGGVHPCGIWVKCSEVKNGVNVRRE